MERARRGQGRSKYILGWIAAALTVLLLGQLLSRGVQPETATAEIYQESRTYLTGTVHMEAQTLCYPGDGEYIPAVESGGRAGAGQALFQLRQDMETAEDSARVRMLRKGNILSTVPPVQKNTMLRETLRALNSGDLRQRRDQSELLGSLSLADESGLLRSMALREAEQRLVAESRKKAAVEAECSGIFAAIWDSGDTDSAGRLVTGDTWTYETALPTEPSVGDTVTLRLFCGIFKDCAFQVEEVKETAEGFACTLSCREQLAAVSQLRTLTAALPQPAPALTVPAEALTKQEGQTGVWCLVGDSTEWKPVTVQKIIDGQAVVDLDRSSTENLMTGDTVLLDVGK